MRSFLNKEKSIAVVGVSSDSWKYGYKVFFDLLSKGYEVYAVHPDGGDIKGEKRYTKLKQLPKTPNMVVTVVSSVVTEKIVHECKDLGIQKVWMQPGSESDKAIEYCKNEGIEVMVRTCIMVETD